MNYKSIVFVILCMSLAVKVLAQTSTQTQLDNQAASGNKAIHGQGTANFIPKFLSPDRIGNSDIFQSAQGSVGIGTTAPQYPLHIFSSSTYPSAGQDFPVALFVETPASVNTGPCPNCAIIGIEGLASASSGNVIGIDGVTFSTDGVGVLGNHPGLAGGGAGVAGVTNSTSGFTVGTMGTSIGTTGPGFGVFGQSNSPDGGGGFFQNNSLQGGDGLDGVTYSTSGFAVGVRGIAVGATGYGVAVFGTASSPNGTAALFNNLAGGNIIVGGVGQPVVNMFRVDSTGRVFADGGFQPSGADFAESMAVAGDRAKYSAGDLLVIDPTASRHVALSRQPYSSLVAGIYSTKPGVLGTTHKVDDSTPESEVPLAVVGIVPCKVTTENGSIQIGDLLVTSSTLGRAMKGTDRNKMLGAVVGKALEPLAKGKGVIQVLVTLQ